MKAFIAKIRTQADVWSKFPNIPEGVQDLLLDAADSLERSEVSIAVWKGKAIEAAARNILTEKSHALEAAEETIDRLIAQREEARKIAEEFRENVSRYDTEIPYIPLPWDPK